MSAECRADAYPDGSLLRLSTGYATYDVAVVGRNSLGCDLIVRWLGANPLGASERSTICLKHLASPPEWISQLAEPTPTPEGGWTGESAGREAGRLSRSGRPIVIPLPPEEPDSPTGSPASS